MFVYLAKPSHLYNFANSVTEIGMIFERSGKGIGFTQNWFSLVLFAS